MEMEEEQRWLEKRPLADEPPPPAADVISWIDHDLVRYGGVLVRTFASALELPHRVSMVAAGLLHRLYSVSSYTAIDVWFAASAAVLAASKVDHETPPLELPEVVALSHYLLEEASGSYAEPLDPFSTKFRKFGSRIAHAERELLRASGFLASFPLPHRHILLFLDAAGLSPAPAPPPSADPPTEGVSALGGGGGDEDEEEDEEEDQSAALCRAVSEMALSVGNDAFLSRIPLCMTSIELGASAVAYAAHEHGITLPPEWFDAVGVSEQTACAFARWMTRLYSLSPPLYSNVANNKEPEFHKLHNLNHPDL